MNNFYKIAQVLLCLSFLPNAYCHNDSVEPKDVKFLYFYKLNYILPYNYSNNLNKALISEHIESPVKNYEFKGQLSFKLPLWRNITKHSSIYAGYTQLSYWQLYANSPFFRETNYEPELFYSYKPCENWYFQLSLNHQSNGRGEEYERSWNKVIADLTFQVKFFRVSLSPWILIFKKNSSELHNPDIDHFLGNSLIKLNFWRGNFNFVISLNNIESGFKRGGQTLHVSYKIKEYIHLYLQGYHGYGQSLIDYNRRTTSAGLGLSFNV